MAALEHAAANGVALVIYTSCYSHPDDVVLVQDIDSGQLSVDDAARVVITHFQLPGLAA